MESVQTKGDRILPERQENHNENIKFQALYFKRIVNEMEVMNTIKPMAMLINTLKAATVKEFPNAKPSSLFHAKACITPKDMPNEAIAKENDAIQTFRLSKPLNLGFKKE